MVVFDHIMLYFKPILLYKHWSKMLEFSFISCANASLQVVVVAKVEDGADLIIQLQVKYIFFYLYKTV